MLIALLTSFLIGSCFATIAVLSIASHSPSLQNLVQDIDKLLDLTIELLKPWALPGSSIECALEIVTTISRKRRFRSRR